MSIKFSLFRSEKEGDKDAQDLGHDGQRQGPQARESQGVALHNALPL